MPRLSSLVCALITLIASAAHAGHTLDTLTEGVAAIATGGNPATMVVCGDAQPLVADQQGRVYAAATTLGLGRVVALGHGGYFTDTRTDTPRFLARSVTWAAGGVGRPLRVVGLTEPIVEALGDLGVDAETASGRSGLDGVDVVIASPQQWASWARLDELERFVRGGGGLVVGECAWGQLQLGRADSLENLAANRLLAAAGIMFTQDAASPVRDGVYPVDLSAARLSNAERALEVLSGDRSGDSALAARVVADAFAVVPLDHPIIATATTLREAHAEQIDAAFGAMIERPLRAQDAPLARALIDLDARFARELPAEQITTHSSAAAFPGLVPADADRSSRTFALETSIPGWRSTGLWAPPGELVTVEIAGIDERWGLAIQIGCWLDPQLMDERVRLPAGVRRFDVLVPTTRVASAIGGPIYIDLPADLPPSVAELRVTITGAVSMPRYRLGHTDERAWRDEIRHAPAPWAELESDELVFTLPSEVVRTLDDPAAVMEHWNAVHRAMDSLQPRSPNHWPDRQYRFVADERLSWGYMYCPANAPVVIPTSAADEMVDAENFDNEGPNRLWGHYHEMGHAHQDPLWTFAGTGEVTVNIFTVYALHTVNGYPLDSEVMRSCPETARRRFAEHDANGAPFDEWKRDPFLALQTYAMLWHEFGFEAFARTFAHYRGRVDQPRSDDERRDAFVVRMSRLVERDLTPYFRAWGVPVSDPAAAESGVVPAWMPLEAR